MKLLKNDMMYSSENDGKQINERVILLLLGITIVLVIMNTTMFNLALPAIQEGFILSSSLSAWIVTGYSIVFAISSITYSRLADFVPIRRLFVIGILSLSLASIVGMFSNGFILLLIVRILQATGAGSVLSLSLVFLSRYIPLDRRGKAMAMIMSSVSLGLGLGPVIGGVIVNYLGWKVLFVVTAVTLLLVPLYMMLFPKEQAKKGSFDVLGALLISIGTTGLLLFLTNHSWMVLILGLIAIVLFVIRIRTAKDPFVLPTLFVNRSYLILVCIGVAAYMCSFSTLFLMPQILVKQYSLNAIQTGLIIFPGSFLAIFVSRKVGRFIDTNGNHMIIRYVPFMLMLSVILFALFEGTSYYAIMFIYMLMSVSFTTLSSSISNEISIVLPSSQVGSGMGLFQLLQFFSGAFGVAITATVMFLQKNLPLSGAYSNIYWGLTVVTLLAIFCGIAYLRNGLPKP